MTDEKGEKGRKGRANNKSNHFKTASKLRNQPVLIDADVAELYGVETKRVNEAVRNNPKKYPYGYIFELDKYEKKEVVENFDHLKK